MEETKQNQNKHLKCTKAGLLDFSKLIAAAARVLCLDYSPKASCSLTIYCIWPLHLWADSEMGSLEELYPMLQCAHTHIWHKIIVIKLQPSSPTENIILELKLASIMFNLSEAQGKIIKTAEKSEFCVEMFRLL